MSRYRKIEVRIWSDENFRSLSDMAKLLWFFLLTGPQTGPIPGLYRAGRAAIAEELEWPLEDFYDRYAELEARGMVRADWKARLVWLPNALKHNLPESPNVVRSWRAEIDLLPECPLKREALDRMRETMAGKGDTFLQAYGEALPEGLAEGFPKAFPKDLPESGTGTGTGTGTGNTPAACTQADPPAPAPPADPPPGALGSTVYSAGELSAVMGRHGINANPGHPDLIALASQGVTPGTVQAACEEAMRSKQGQPFGMAYVMRILERWKADAAKLDLAGVSAPKPSPAAWWASDAAILAKGVELSLSPRAGEQMQAFKGRIQARLDGTDKPPPAALPRQIDLAPRIEPRGFKPAGLNLKSLVRQVAPHPS